jgi:Zn-dependent protease
MHLIYSADMSGVIYSRDVHGTGPNSGEAMQDRKPSLQLEWQNGFLFAIFALLLICVVRFSWRQGLLCTALFFVSLLAHEAGHMLLADMNQTRVKAIGFCKWGVYLRREKAEGMAEVAISAAGPTVNLLIAYFFHDFSGTGTLAWLSQMNAVLFLINILPIGGSDGKRILTTLRELRAQRLAMAPITNTQP